MTRKNLKIRKANEQDYKAVNYLYYSTYSLLAKNIPDNYKEPPKKTLPKGTFLNILEDKDALIIVAELDKHIVGMLYAIIEKDDGDEWVQPRNRVSIDEISVLPEFFNQRVGTGLMEVAESWAKEKSIPELIVIVHDFNKIAISFYEKNDYKPYSIQMNKKI